MLGVRYQILPEGLVITEVLPGTAAARAGVQRGDLLVGVGGAPVDAGAVEATLSRLSGPPGAELSLTLRGPLGAAERTVEVTLGARIAEPPPPPEPSMDELRRALDRGRPEAAERAAHRLLAEQGADRELNVARVMRVEGRANPEAAVAASRVLVQERPDDLELAFLAGEALYRAGGWREAAEHLSRVERTRPADVAGEGGWRGDAGGDPLGRSMLVEALFRDGQVEAARAEALSLARTRRVPELLALVGSPAPDPGQTWRAEATPVEELALTLLDGSLWRLSEHRGEPVLINFWASWCGPCKLEMPELERLWDERKDKGFQLIAVSMDDPRDRDEVLKLAARYRMPIAMDDTIGERFGVEALPSNRLIDRGGALRYGSQAYSPEAFQRLTDQVDLALADPPGADTALGEAWTSGRATLLQALPISGLEDVWAGAEGVVVGVRGGAPRRLEWTELGLARPVAAPVADRASVSSRVAWAGGPVGATTGRPWVRAFTEEGAPRWLVTTPSEVEDLEVLDGRLWVATEDEVLVLDAGGALVTRHPRGAEDLAATAGGLWAVDGDQRLWLTEAEVSLRGEARDSACALADGRVGSKVVSACVSGRFGEGGAVRAVVARPDGVVVALDGAGRPAFTLTLPGRARLAAWDPDGDGVDELLVAVQDRALARIELQIP